MTIIVKLPSDGCQIAVKTIIDLPNYRYRPIDVKADKVSFDLLQDELRDAENSTYTPEEFTVFYRHPDLPEHGIEVYDHASVLATLIDSQKKMRDTISLFLVPKVFEKDIVWLGAKDASAKDKMPVSQGQE